jgi:hypothetical protein
MLVALLGPKMIKEVIFRNALWATPDSWNAVNWSPINSMRDG